MINLRIPSTSANVGPGFDSFGLALGCYNYLSCAESEELVLDIKGEGAETAGLGKDHLLVRSAQKVYDHAGAGEVKLAFSMLNNIPISRGLGSSSAVIAGGMAAANIFLGRPLDTKELIGIAAAMEGHPDNVAPALLGGFVVCCYDGEKLYTEKIEPPQGLKAVVAVPEIRIDTSHARKDLPDKVPFTDAVFNLSHAALLTVSIMRGDLEMFAQMLKDRLHQPYRLKHIPGAFEVVKAAEDRGALGCVLSGSGSTMISFTTKNEKHIAAEMEDAFRKAGVTSRASVLQIDGEGAKIISYNVFAEEKV